MPLSFSERLRRLQQKGQKGDRYPDIGSFKSGANGQAQSPFFRLPREVRDVVYLELWRSKGLEQHVFSENGRYRHTPCITSYSNLGQCEVKLDQLSDQDWQLPASDPSIDMEWVNRHVSKFNGHWRCEDRYNETMAGVEPCLFMSCLLTCKTLYLECRESIYGNVDFIFTSIGEAHNFLLVRKSPIVKELELLSFSLRLSRLHSEDSDSEPSTRRWMEDGAQWQRVRKSLADLPKLRKITIWLEVAGALRSVDTRVNLDPLTFEPEVAPLVTLDTVFLKSIDWKDVFGVDYDSR